MKEIIEAIRPALVAALKRAALVASYIVLSALVASVEAFVAGRTSLDVSLLLAVNLGLAAARKALEELRTRGATEPA